MTKTRQRRRRSFPLALSPSLPLFRCIAATHAATWCYTLNHVQIRRFATASFFCQRFIRAWERLLLIFIYEDGWTDPRIGVHLFCKFNVLRVRRSDQVGRQTWWLQLKCLLFSIGASSLIDAKARNLSDEWNRSLAGDRKWSANLWFVFISFFDWNNK